MENQPSDFKKNNNYSSNCWRFVLKIMTAFSILAVVFIVFNHQLIVNEYKKAWNKFLVARTEEMNILGKMPVAQGEKSITFDWQYKNKKYSITEKLYESYYEFYANSAKGYRYIGDLDINWQEKYYARFIAGASEDNLVERIAEAIRLQGQANKLSEDEIVELALAFVQSIPYDDDRGQAIMKNDVEVAMQFPYETLYRQKGVCGDKSFLGAKIIQNLGYGTALFVYEKEKHMSLGIACDSQYSNYQSGYCYAETTNPGFKIGMIPDIDPKTAQSVALKKLGSFETISSQFDVQKLSEPALADKTSGQAYMLIGSTLAISQKLDALMTSIKTLSQDLNNRKVAVEKMEKDLKNQQTAVEKLSQSENTKKYLNSYHEYVADYKKYQQQINEYNNLVKNYNSKIKEYNTLLERFN